jgi:hypothetical protein
MKTFFEKEVEINNCRLYIVANDSTATLTIEQVPTKYKVDSKVHIVNCHFFNWDADRLEAISNSIAEGMAKGVTSAFTALRDEARRMFKDEYSVVCKEVDCFMVKPLSGHGFKVQGQDFSSFCTMDGLRIDNGEASYSCACPEEIKAVFRSICTGEIKSHFEGDIHSFIEKCKTLGCNVLEEKEN